MSQDTRHRVRTKGTRRPKKIRDRPGGAAKKADTEHLREQIISEFGLHVRKDAWAPQRWAMKQKLGAAPKAVLLTLVHHVNEFGYARPSAKRLGEEVGIDRSNIWRHLRALEDGGLVVRIAWLSKKNGACVANGYIVPFWQDPDAVSQEKKPPKGSLVGLDAVLQQDDRGRSRATPSASAHHALGAQMHRTLVRQRTTVNRQEDSHEKNRPFFPSSLPSDSQVHEPRCGNALGGEGSLPQVDEKKVDRKEDAEQQTTSNHLNNHEAPSATSHRGSANEDRDGLDDDTDFFDPDRDLVDSSHEVNPYMKNQNADIEQTTPVDA